MNAALRRKRAEEKLASSLLDDGDKSQSRRQLHELQVHQIELEMQNNELQIHQIELEFQNKALQKAQIAERESSQRYAELYDFAPVPYLTIGHYGIIQHANPAAALLLEKSRNTLYEFGLGIFFSDAALPIFNAFMDKAFASSEEQRCEIELLVGSNTLSVIMHACRNQKGTALLFEITDITELKLYQQTLIESEANLDIERSHLQSLIRAIPDLVWLKDTNGVYVSCNKRFESFFGAKFDEILGKTDYDFVDKKLANFFRFHDKAAMQSDIPLVNEEQITFNDGHTELLETTKTTMRNQGGKIIGVLGIGHNITRRKLLEASLIEKEKSLTVSLAISSQNWFEVNLLTGDMLVSPDYPERLGYDPAEFQSNLQSWQDSLHPEDADAVMTAFRNCLVNDSAMSMEYRQRKQDGSWLWFKSTAKVIERGPEHKPLRMVGIHADITPMKEQHVQLEQIAHYDSLTNLPNRLLLADRLSQAMMQCQRHDNLMAVAFLDLDGFKVINNTHGHDIGDELLIALAQRMKEILCVGDTLAHFGGDKFVAILTDLVKVEDCQPFLERLIFVASQPVNIGGEELNISSSMGVTLYPHDHVDAEKLLKHAEKAMYTAKKSGKNRYHIFDSAHSHGA